MLGLVTRNAGWSALHPSQALAAHRAMRLYRKHHPDCEACGAVDKVQVHHIVSLWAGGSPDDPHNMISLCMTSRRCHLHVGHDGNFRTRYVSNCREFAALIRGAVRMAVVTIRDRA